MYEQTTVDILNFRPQITILPEKQLCSLKQQDRPHTKNYSRENIEYTFPFLLCLRT